MSSKIGRASTTTDAAFDEHERRMQIIEQGADRLVKDSRLFRDSVQGLLKSGADFGKAFETIFQPIGSNDVGLDKKNPASELTLNNITMYQVLMAELKDTLAPELDLIEGRVMTPAKEFKELLQRVRKTIVKRNHKLVDYDRFNNSLSKLREKKDKTMSDEKNLFKLENEFENAQAEYEHYNNLTKTELPQLYVMAQKFITPLFHSFYYMQLNIYYLILDKVQAFASDKYDLNYGDAESAYMANDQGANVQVEELTKRLTALSTGKFGAQIRRNKSKTAAGGEGGGGVGVEEGDEYDMGSSSDVKSPGGAAGLGRSGSGFSSAPPAYDASPSSASKRPPPPPPMKPKPKGSIVTALYDFEPQAEGDLGFRAGDQIEVIQRTESTNDCSISMSKSNNNASLAGSYESFESDSVNSEEEEDLDDYCKGGYHHTMIGDTFADGRYTIVRKLGWGHFSLVWLAKDHKTNKHVALKIVKSAPHYTETALDEIKLLQRLVSSEPRHPGRRHSVLLLDHFRHRGPNGSHVCMVFEVLGENLLGLIKRYQHRGVPIQIVKQVAKQILLSLDYMHNKCGIIHTDIKPENVLICIDDVEVVVKAELDNSVQAVPTKLVGVPPSQGRGGAQTPRREGIFITGSQPLPSPSSSMAGSPMMDKWSFGMSKISGVPGIGQSPNSFRSTQVSTGFENSAEMIGKDLKGVKLASDKPSSPLSQPGDSYFGEKTTAKAPKAQGPSLLSQQAPQQPSTSSTSSTVVTNQNPQPGEPTKISADSPFSTSLPQYPRPSHAPHYSHSPNEDMHDNIPTAPYDPESLERLACKIADLGNACWIDHHFTNDIQTRQYRCPEVILGGQWGPSADLWSTACMIFELITGDYLFDPQSGTKYGKDDDHMAQVMELLGNMPKELINGKYSLDLFNRRAELRRIHKLRYWPLDRVLREKYLMSAEEANVLTSFLVPMLDLNPETRVRPRDLLEHEWITDVITDGEIEKIHYEEMLKNNRGDLSALRESDALKSLDEAVILGGLTQEQRLAQQKHQKELQEQVNSGGHVPFHGATSGTVNPVGALGHGNGTASPQIAHVHAHAYGA
ncbi:hypothetical protein E3P92_02548 [Wallemia ichthyophaga]|uniref:non-specific serine/threonine protein kinase n=2 Tax=Wallemia ichthyophaga TaxID=245174 RepID=A0A4T0KMR8_WALIC|nr:hypothetical protein E3P91_02970 [Wallemia ichthyophaga]TIA81051.1 hypothetical protein E3P98_02304 [Wallemia ichthyophaga]TIA90267.1 hypothetical protein E3P97_02626 [Wallemia ichthyophaga]TIB10328.1 hypothetical protein E3P93_02930 [Wallemia ichthyophaga]TIB12495.1 hypothetical protein E3P92_02548 [Wallemia ichthyophaga]